MKASLMPSMDNVAQTVMSRWLTLSDMDRQDGHPTHM